MKILLVDDEAAVGRLFKQRFRKQLKEGLFELIFCTSGEEALAAYGGDWKHQVILILSDIHMPGINGLQLLEKIRTMDPNIPVYMISAFSNGEYTDKAVELGANGFIPKPLDMTKIAELIEDLQQ